MHSEDCRRRRAACLLLIALLLMPATGWAQGATEAAQEAFDRGTAFYVEKEYSRAIVEFRKAHRLAPTAIFLYNIALSYQKLGDYTQAHAFAEKAGAFGGLPAQAQVKNGARLTALGARLQAARLAGRLAPQPVAPSPAPERAVEPQAHATTGPAAMSGVGYAGIGAAALGAGLLVWSGVVAADVGERHDALAEVDSRAVYDEKLAGIDDDQQLGQIALFSGVGLVAVGAGLVAWDLFDDQPEGVALGVTPGGEATVRWQGRW